MPCRLCTAGLLPDCRQHCSFLVGIMCLAQIHGGCLANNTCKCQCCLPCRYGHVPVSVGVEGIVVWSLVVQNGCGNIGAAIHIAVLCDSKGPLELETPDMQKLRLCVCGDAVVAAPLEVCVRSGCNNIAVQILSSNELG